MTRRRRSRSGRSPWDSAVTEFTWSTSLKTSSSMKYHRVSTGSPCVADPCGVTSLARPLGDQNSVPVLVGDLPATARNRRPKLNAACPLGPLPEIRSCLVPSLISWILNLSLFLLFFFLVFVLLLLLSQYACHGGQKGSQQLRNITFIFLHVRLFPEAFVLQNPRIPFKTSLKGDL